MIFVVLLWLSAFFIAGVAGYFSIIGLATTFAGNFWSVVVMGVSLELGKLVSVSYLYRSWSDVAGWIRTYIFLATMVLMLITSMGIYGFLTQGFSEATLAYNSNSTTLQVYESQLQTMRERKKEIDIQIASAGEQKDKERLIWMFRKESSELNKRIFELEPKIMPLKTEVLQTGSHIGPIKYIAETFHWTVNVAVSVVTLMIISVFDPLAVALTLAANQATLKYHRNRQQKAEELLKQQKNSTQDPKKDLYIAPAPTTIVQTTKEENIPQVDKVPENIVGYSVKHEPSVQSFLSEDEFNLLQLIREATKINKPLPTLNASLGITEDEAAEKITQLYNKLRKAGFSNAFIFRG